MLYRIEPDRLIMTVRPDEQRDLGECLAANTDRFDSDDFLADMLVSMMADGQFVWLNAAQTGDLTDGPMFGILGEEEVGPEEEKVGSCLFHVGRWGDGNHYQPILYRWVFMSYAVTTPQRELLEQGEAVWQGGDLLEREGQMEIARQGEVFLQRPEMGG